MITTKLHLIGTDFGRKENISYISVDEKALRLTPASLNNISVSFSDRQGGKGVYKHIFHLGVDRDDYDLLLNTFISRLSPAKQSALFAMVEKIFLDWCARRRGLCDTIDPALMNSFDSIRVSASQYVTLEQYEIMAKSYSNASAKINCTTKLELVNKTYPRLLIALLHHAIQAELNTSYKWIDSTKHYLTDVGAAYFIAIRESSGIINCEDELRLNSLADYDDVADRPELTEVASGIYSYRSSSNGTLRPLCEHYGQGLVDAQTLKEFLTICPWTVQWVVTSFGNIKRLFTSYTGWSLSQFGQRIVRGLRSGEIARENLLYLGNYGRTNNPKYKQNDYDRVSRVLKNADEELYLEVRKSKDQDSPDAWGSLLSALSKYFDNTPMIGVLDLAQVEAADHPITMTSRSLITDVSKSINANLGRVSRSGLGLSKQTLDAQDQSKWDNLAKIIRPHREGHNPYD